MQRAQAMIRWIAKTAGQDCDHPPSMGCID
jgi:hypothetical protein